MGKWREQTVHAIGNADGFHFAFQCQEMGLAASARSGIGGGNISDLAPLSSHRSTPSLLSSLTSPLQRAWKETRERSDWEKFHPGEIGPGALFPKVADAESFAAEHRERTVAEAMEVLQGKFRGFGDQVWRVHTPPVWHRDYLTGCELATTATSPQLRNPKAQGRLQLRAVWALNRWSHLVTLAQAYHFSREEHFREVLCDWLADWNLKNPLGRGWNWMEPEEAAARLCNLSWIDALVRLPGHLLDQLLPKHVWWVARYGPQESAALPWMSGLICALARWPQAADWGESLPATSERWQTAVLREIRDDGRFGATSWDRQRKAAELLIAARAALLAREIPIPEPVEHRLRLAADFIIRCGDSREPWPFGEAGEGDVFPDCSIADWLAGEDSVTSKWHGAPPKRISTVAPQDFHIGGDEAWRWLLHQRPSSGSHGHQDAQHLSLWIDHLAVFIDPGSGFPSAGHHNGPCPMTTSQKGGISLRPLKRAFHPRRSIAALPSGWRITDAGDSAFSVRWLLAPGWEIEPHDGSCILFREGHTLELSVRGGNLEITSGQCSPSFGQQTEAPVLFVQMTEGGSLITDIVSRPLL